MKRNQKKTYLKVFLLFFYKSLFSMTLEGDIWTQLKNVTNKAGVVLKEAAAAREKKRRLMSLSLNVTGGDDYLSCEDQPKSKRRKNSPKEKGSRGRRPRKINEEEASTQKRDLTEFFDYVHPYSSLTFTPLVTFSARFFPLQSRLGRFALPCPPALPFLFS